MIKAESGFIKRTNLIVLLLIGLFLAGVVTLLPKGFSDDLSLIGKGPASVVLTHDKNLVGSQLTMGLLGRIRQDYEPDVNFIVVDVATPKGQKFMREQQADLVSLVFFDADGNKMNYLEGGATEPAVRAVLDDILAG